MAKKTFNQIVTNMIARIRSRNARIETAEGSFTRDVIIDAPATEIANLHDRIEQVSREQSILTASDSGLNSIGENFGLLRKGASKAQGVITFVRNTSPSSDITIPAGSIVSTPSTAGGRGTQFRTLYTVVMYKSLAATYLNIGNGKYEIETEIECSSLGTIGNVGPNTITFLPNPITGIDGCYNDTSTSGGAESESSSSFSQRLKGALTGNNLGTSDGYQERVLALSGVEEVKVVSGASTLRSDAGAVDIYIKGRVLQDAEDVVTFYSSPFPNIVLTKQPVTAVDAVLSSTLGSLSTSLWEFVEDTKLFGNSVLGQDKISWKAPIDVSYGTITVRYTYNKLVKEVQSFINTPANQVINSNVLIKWAFEYPIDVTIKVRILSGYDSTVVENQIRTVVESRLNTYKIGQAVHQSEILKEVTSVAGISDVLVPFTEFSSTDDTITPDTFLTLNLPEFGYATAGTVTVITVV